MNEPAKPARPFRRWSAYLLLAMIVVPLGLAFHDWAQAVRTAYNSASSLAWSNAAGRFLGREWTEPLPRGLTVAVTETPPQAGEYAGYGYATHVETVYEWQPIFHYVIGGPYLIRGRATAAILRDESGKWTPMLVK